jgi:hypothetical protein
LRDSGQWMYASPWIRQWMNASPGEIQDSGCMPVLG